MPSTPRPQPTLVAALGEDHRRIGDLFAALGTGPRWRRASVYLELRRLLVAHELAEEVAVYPAFTHGAVEGSPIADRRALAAELRSQERGIECSLQELVSAELGAATGGRDESGQLLAALEHAVRSHQDDEERRLFPYLERLGEPDMNAAIADDYRRVRRSAPVRPHPKAPHAPPADLVLWPVLRRIDRVRDALVVPVLSWRMGRSRWLVRRVLDSVVAPIASFAFVAVLGRLSRSRRPE